MRTLKPIGERINMFDNLDEQTVGTFNKIFIECPLTDPGNLPVEIGQYVGADRREIFIGDSKPIHHKMFKDLLYNIDRDLFTEDQTDKELEEIYGHSIN